MTKIAGRIVLSDEGLSIDGEPFPWHVGTDISVGEGPLRGVVVEIFCEEIFIESIPKHCSVGCEDHRPVQHRDARPPWCKSCGLTSDGQVPTSKLKETRA